jgi:hypothetical protein
MSTNSSDQDSLQQGQTQTATQGNGFELNSFLKRSTEGARVEWDPALLEIPPEGAGWTWLDDKFKIDIEKSSNPFIRKVEDAAYRNVSHLTDLLRWLKNNADHEAVRIASIALSEIASVMDMEFKNMALQTKVRSSEYIPRSPDLSPPDTSDDETSEALDDDEEMDDDDDT